MTMKWGFQSKAIASVIDAYAQGKRRVLLVAPTGSGKTRMGSEIASGFKGNAVWIAHREELVSQAAKSLREVSRPGEVGVMARGFRTNAGAKIQVSTVQTMIRREMPTVQMVILDEAHHYEADEWRKVHEAYPDALILGLTATPERSDGSRLGDIFDEMVVAAHYSDLVRAGVLVPWDVLQPDEFLGADRAQDPLDAYLEFGGNRKAIAFYYRVWQAAEEAGRLRRRGIKAESIYGKLPKPLRKRRIDGFRGSSYEVLNNVYCLTEGFDAPEASVVILARPFLNRANYVQVCGRAGRSHPGKGNALLIDLCGSSHIHGSPVADWDYKLEGRGNREAGGSPKEPPERGPQDLGAILGVGLRPAPFSASQTIERAQLGEATKVVGSEQVDSAIADVLKKKGLSAADRAKHLFRSL